jgi:hypothetical protein
MGHTYDKSASWPSGASSVSSVVGLNLLCLARARPRLPGPRESHRRPLLQLCGACLRILEQARSCPLADFRLAQAQLHHWYYQWKASTPELTYYPRAFCHIQHGLFAIFSTVPTTTAWTTSLWDRLGYMTEPSTLILALYMNQTSPLDISQQQIQAPYHMPYHLQGLGFASSPYAANPDTPSSSPWGYK